MEHNLIQSYIKQLNTALKEAADGETIEDFKKLIALEGKFARKLRNIAGGKKVYRDFIFYIMEDKDLREARPYFRERENMYKDIINVAIRERKPNDLHKMRVNFLFCSFAIDQLKKSEKLDIQLGDIYQQIKQTREKIIHKHLHYALNRAKSFNTGVNHAMDFGDLIQVANEALVISVDKYVIDENSSPFHVMAMGRMISSLIASGDQSLAVTLGGNAPRKLYQIRKLLNKTPGLSTKEIGEMIGMIEEEVSLLMNVSSTKSLDQPLNKDDGEADVAITLKDFLPANVDEHNDPHLMIEKDNLMATAAEFFSQLTLLEQKALRLKGVNFKDYI